jgi:hypothetical protein
MPYPILGNTPLGIVSAETDIPLPGAGVCKLMVPRPEWTQPFPRVANAWLATPTWYLKVRSVEAFL